MTEAPSIKEALEIVENLIRRDPACFNLSDELLPVRAALRALATLSPPAGERREAIAREPAAWRFRYEMKEGAWGKWTVQKNKPNWYSPDQADVEVEPLYVASGFVQDEAGWRDISTAPKDMTEVIVLCGPKDVRLGWYFAPSSTTFGWFDQHQKPIKPTNWMPLPAIRSARDGGAS